LKDTTTIADEPRRPYLKSLQALNFQALKPHKL